MTEENKTDDVDQSVGTSRPAVEATPIRDL
jgi:hypothetical protein